jgi:hypothetical protein
MPSSQTAGDLVKGSMRLIGAIATGETPSSDEANDGLNTLNDLLETWSLENLTVWGNDDQTFAFTAGQGIYTIGPAGNFATSRPVRVPGMYCTFNGVDFAIDPIGDAEYDAIGLKNQPDAFPRRFLYLNANPLGILKFWPVPTSALAVTINADQVLTQVANLATVMVFPPGYLLAMKHALAILLAPDYGIEPSPTIQRVALVSKANLKRANKLKRIARFDAALSEGPPVTWQSG